MKTYSITKVDSKGNETNYGSGYEDIYDVVPKNYKFNGFFYEAKATKTIYMVEED